MILVERAEGLSRIVAEYVEALIKLFCLYSSLHATFNRARLWWNTREIVASHQVSTLGSICVEHIWWDNKEIVPSHTSPP